MTADQSEAKDMRYSGTVVRAAVRLLHATGRPLGILELENNLGLVGYYPGTVKIGLMSHLESGDYHGGIFTLNEEYKFQLLPGLKPAVLERRLRRADRKEYKPSLPGSSF